MTKHALLIPAAIAAVSLSACTDPKQPSKENFAAAIVRSLEKSSVADRSLCLNLPGRLDENHSLDIVQSKRRFEAGDASHEETRRRNALSALAENGLFTRTDSEFQQQGYEDRRFFKDHVRTTFTLTEPAKSMLQEGKEAEYFMGVVIGYSPVPALCVGELELVGIDGYTEPADLNGKRVSEVTARFRYTGLPAWMSDAAVAGYWKAAASAAEGDMARKVPLVLTGDGWEVLEK